MERKCLNRGEFKCLHEKYVKMMGEGGRIVSAIVIDPYRMSYMFSVSGVDDDEVDKMYYTGLWSNEELVDSHFASYDSGFDVETNIPKYYGGFGGGSIVTGSYYDGIHEFRGRFEECNNRRHRNGMKAYLINRQDELRWSDDKDKQPRIGYVCFYCESLYEIRLSMFDDLGRGYVKDDELVAFLENHNDVCSVFNEVVLDGEFNGVVEEWTDGGGCVKCDWNYCAEVHAPIGNTLEMSVQPRIIRPSDAHFGDVWRCCFTNRVTYKVYGLEEDGKNWNTEPVGILNQSDDEIDKGLYKPDWCPKMQVVNGEVNSTKIEDVVAFDGTPLKIKKDGYEPDSNKVMYKTYKDDMGGAFQRTGNYFCPVCEAVMSKGMFAKHEKLHGIVVVKGGYYILYNEEAGEIRIVCTTGQDHQPLLIDKNREIREIESDLIKYYGNNGIKAIQVMDELNKYGMVTGWKEYKHQTRLEAMRKVEGESV